MGIETAVFIAATVAASAAEISAASEKTRALNLQQQQAALQTKQKTLSNYDVMEKTLDAQIAHESVNGTAFSSPSFNAIQRNTLNIAARTQENTDIEGAVAESNFESEKANVRDTLFAQLFGNVANTAFSAAAMNKSAPTKAVSRDLGSVSQRASSF